MVRHNCVEFEVQEKFQYTKFHEFHEFHEIMKKFVHEKFQYTKFRMRVHNSVHAVEKNCKFNTLDFLVFILLKAPFDSIDNSIYFCN